MTDSVPTPPATPIVMTGAEFFWLTAGMWISGVCLLALMPVVLMPRLGAAMGLAVSYLLFFLGWQPLQRIAQRAQGPRASLVRMLTLVGTAAVAAYYVREALLELVRRAG